MGQKNKKGFTLIELLVVISIISLLSSIIFASLNAARAKARDAKRLQDRDQVVLALQYFYDANGRFPTSAAGGANWSCLAPGGENCWGVGGFDGADSLVTDLSQYLKTFPKNNADVGNVAYDRLIYITSYPGNLAGQTGAFLVWVQEVGMVQAQCPSAYPVQHIDKYWYCYQSLGQ